MYKIIFFNSVENSKSFYNIDKETKNFVYLNNGYDAPIKVSKKTSRVWVLKDEYSFETAKANIIEKINN